MSLNYVVSLSSIIAQHYLEDGRKKPPRNTSEYVPRLHGVTYFNTVQSCLKFSVWLALLLCSTSPSSVIVPTDLLTYLLAYLLNYLLNYLLTCLLT